MESSGHVKNDIETVISAINSYSGTVDGLNGSWKGPSYDSFNKNTSSFISEYSKAISSQGNSFIEAIDLYEEYKTAKKNKGIAEGNVDEANRCERPDEADDWRKKAAEYDNSMKSLKGKIEAALAAAASTKLEATPLSIPTSVTSAASTKPRGNYEGEKYWHFQGNGYNCGMTAFLMGVNTLLGEDRFTDNVGEWEKVGGDTTTIGWGDSTMAQDWLNENGLSDQIAVTGIECIHSKEDLYEHLDKGEVVIASTSGNHFKRNDGSVASLDHYIMFYKNEDGVCYANDSSGGSEEDRENLSGVPYTPEDLDAFYSEGAHGSVTLAPIG